MIRVALAAVLVAGLSASASAQDRPRPAVELTVGWVGFVDDATVHERLVAAGVRWYVSPRVSLGPEISYMVGPRTLRDLLVTGNVVFDFVTPRTGAPARPITPYLVAGAGIFSHGQKFAGRTFRSNEGGFTGGGGARIRISDRVYVAPEFRIGWEMHVRAAVTLGIRIGQ
jgi:opacity protein-like surface antigen